MRQATNADRSDPFRFRTGKIAGPLTLANAVPNLSLGTTEPRELRDYEDLERLEYRPAPWPHGRQVRGPDQGRREGARARRQGCLADIRDAATDTWRLPEERKFPPPWQVVEIEGGYKVTDANGFQLTWVYARDEQALRHTYPTRPEALKIARLIARLPELAGGQVRPPGVDKY